MWRITRLLALIGGALGFLFLAPAPKAYAWDDGPRVAFHGHFGLPHGSASVYVNDGRFFHHRAYYRPYYRHYYYRPYSFGRHFYRPHYRPYRIARVYVYDPFPVYAPFPHWVSRPVYSPYFCPY